LLVGKDLARKALVSSPQVAIDPRGKEWSHTLALSLIENRNKRRRIASVEAPLIFNVSHTSRKTRRCKLGSSINVPPNCDGCTMEMSAGLSSKFLATIGDTVMLGVLL